METPKEHENSQNPIVDCCCPSNPSQSNVGIPSGKNRTPHPAAASDSSGSPCHAHTAIRTPNPLGFETSTSR